LLSWHQAIRAAQSIRRISIGILTSQSTLGFLAGTTTSVLVVTTLLSLIPTFLVPFYLLLHLIALAQVRGYWAQQRLILTIVSLLASAAIYISLV